MVMVVDTLPARSEVDATETLRTIRAELIADKAFMAIRDRRFYIKLGEQAALFGAGAALIFLFETLALRLLGVVLIGAVYARNLELVHECIHFTAVRSRPLNRIYGIALALPLFTSFEEWRISHLRHHADVRNEGFEYRLEDVNSWPRLLLHLFLIDHFRQAVAKMARSVPGRLDAPAPIRAGAIRDHRIMAAAVLFAVLASVIFQTWAFVWLWFLPLIPAAVINFHIQLPEHFACDTASQNVLRNSRTIRASRLAAWFVNNNNLHTSHHWLATAPINHLPTINRHIFGHVQSVEGSYWTFYAGFYRRFLDLVSARRAASVR